MADPGIVPSAPLIPELTPSFVQRQLIEWKERADLAQHAFDGQWRELVAYPQFNLHMMERWIKIDEQYVEMQHTVCPIGSAPPEVAISPPHALPPFESARTKFLDYIKGMRESGEAIPLGYLAAEVLCRTGL